MRLPLWTNAMRSVKPAVQGGAKVQFSFAGVLQSADEARDERRWPKAALLYAEYLASNPDDFGIWVQRGHAEKEAGNFDIAEYCYLEARKLKPEDEDLWLQFGHLHKIGFRHADAAAAYAKCLSINPRNFDALRELNELDARGLGRSRGDDRRVEEESGPVEAGFAETNQGANRKYVLSIRVVDDDFALMGQLASAAARGAEERAVLARLLVHRDPLNVSKWNELAKAFVDCGRLEDAERCHLIVASIDDGAQTPAELPQGFLTQF